MQRTRPTSATSQIHSVLTPLPRGSRLRSGIRSMSSDSPSLGPSAASSSIWISPSTRIDGRACDARYSVDAPRAAAIRRSRSRPDAEPTTGGGVSDRTGLRDSGSTTAGCGGSYRAAGGGAGLGAGGGAGGGDGAGGVSDVGTNWTGGAGGGGGGGDAAPRRATASAADRSRATPADESRGPAALRAGSPPALHLPRDQATGPPSWASIALRGRDASCQGRAPEAPTA